MSEELRFVPIDLELHAELCVRFRRDTFVCSFGGTERFDREYGADGAGYLTWVADRLSKFPLGMLHVWRGSDIIGQIEMRPRGDPPVGYVHLFYLVPEARGTSVGASMHDHVTSLFDALGIRKLRLSVSPTNARAIAYFEKHGWEDLGPRPGVDGVNLMGRALEPRKERA